MTGVCSREMDIASVELICAEHLQRTLLACDEATAFQRILSLAVAIHGGRWGFEQYQALGANGRHMVPSPLHSLLVGKRDDCRQLKGSDRTVAVLERREKFRRNEGSLLYRMAVASRGIRQTATALHPTE